MLSSNEQCSALLSIVVVWLSLSGSLGISSKLSFVSCLEQKKDNFSIGILILIHLEFITLSIYQWVRIIIVCPTSIYNLFLVRVYVPSANYKLYIFMEAIVKINYTVQKDQRRLPKNWTIYVTLKLANFQEALSSY